MSLPEIHDVPIFYIGGRITLPKPDAGEKGPIQTVESLRTHLQTAMAVELSTIPLYLYATFSVKNTGDGDAAISAVTGVVNEEMLHLSLGGNTLLAVGGLPKLYDSKIVPQYPQPMLGRTPELTLNLRQMTKENLQTFIDVETPEASGAKPQPDEYQSLGQFYAAIQQGLKYLNGIDKKLFHPATASQQFAPDSGLYDPPVADAGGLVTVTDLSSALKALQIIIDQGEGNPGPYDDPSHQEKDHYAIFSDLKAGSLKWDLYPVPTNPTTAGYKDKGIHQVSLTFDATYCYLLLTLEKLWTLSSESTRSTLIETNIFPIMKNILLDFTKFLISQPTGTGNEVAAPCFGFYSFTTGSEFKQLQQEMKAAVDAYTDTSLKAKLEAIQKKVNKLVDIHKV